MAHAREQDNRLPDDQNDDDNSEREHGTEPPEDAMWFIVVALWISYATLAIAVICFAFHLFPLRQDSHKPTALIVHLTFDDVYATDPKQQALCLDGCADPEIFAWNTPDYGCDWSLFIGDDSCAYYGPVYVSTDVDADALSEYAVSLRFMPRTNNGYHIIWSDGTFALEAYHGRLRLAHAGMPLFLERAQVRTGGSVDDDDNDYGSDRAVSQCKWSHITVVRRRGGNTTLYVDGRDVGTATGNQLALNTFRGLLIGGLHGRYDDLRVYNGSRTHMEVLEAFENDTDMHSPAACNVTGDIRAVLYQAGQSNLERYLEPVRVYHDATEIETDDMETDWLRSSLLSSGYLKRNVENVSPSKTPELENPYDADF